MHIAYLYDGSYPSTGADAWQVLNTATALSRQGARVTVICVAPSHRAPLSSAELMTHYGLEGEVELIQLPRPRFTPRALHKWIHCRTALRLPEAQKADVIYSRNLPAIFTAARRGRDTIYDTYRPWPDQVRVIRMLLRRVFLRPNLLGGFFHSSHARQAYLNAGINPDKLCVAHNGFHPKLFEIAPSRADARREFGLPADRFIIGYTGRLDQEKGILALLDLADAMPEITLLLAGGSSDEAILKRARATQNVCLFDWQKPNKVPTMLSACDLLMIPSSSIALKTGNTVLPMKIFEYLASGRPIIAPRSPDTADVLRHNENAWLVESDQLDEVVKQTRALQEDEALRARLSSGALESAQSLTWDARGKRVLQTIQAWRAHE